MTGNEATLADIGPSPSGTVTFLFSDIEGSSRIEQAVGTERYAALLARHREILRTAFQAHGGAERAPRATRSS
jgi:class 3 adenylate cyclase